VSTFIVNCDFNVYIPRRPGAAAISFARPSLLIKDEIINKNIICVATSEVSVLAIFLFIFSVDSAIISVLCIFPSFKRAQLN